MTVATAKRCVLCQTDVSHMRRVKDTTGNYYCEPCYANVQSAGKLPQASPPPLSAPVPNQSQGEAFLARFGKVRWGLHEKATCPHCWHAFAPEEVLWISQHVELQGDVVLGPDAPMRFFPSRFTPEGHAIDARGSVCQMLACPRCHLSVPRNAIDTELLFTSIIGVPSSGKSYLLTSMIWQLRQMLPSRFALSFVDADTVSNRSLNEYEETLFLASDPDDLVAIRKTETEGELYDQVRIGEQVLSLPRPFLFTIKPQASHPNYTHTERISRLICLYDNAGEHFLPGSDAVASPVTQHLAKSRVLMFLYDPMQDPRFRQRCVGTSNDPQLAKAAPTSRQETTLTETAQRVRRYSGLGSNQKHKAPLIVIIPKQDVWGHLLDANIDTDPYTKISHGTLSSVDVRQIEEVSKKLRQLLTTLVPELVASAEDFCETVIYVPVSATGCSPETDESGKRYGIRPKNIQPRWATVPFMYMFAKWSTGLIADSHAKSNKTGGSK